LRSARRLSRQAAVDFRTEITNDLIARLEEEKAINPLGYNAHETWAAGFDVARVGMPVV
jgi:hypothetical protein